MFSRRFACFLLGMWLAGGFLTAWLAFENSRTVDRLMSRADPAAMLRIKVLGTSETSVLLRYEAAEQNRRMFELWEIAQLALGSFLFFFLLFGTNEGKGSLVVALIMLAVVIAQRFYLTPELTSNGRVVDFTPDNVYSSFRARAVVLQGGYMGAEIGKWVLGILLTVILLARGRGQTRSKGVWNQFNVIDKADHSHIDR
jgi:hypothetical protein